MAKTVKTDLKKNEKKVGKKSDSGIGTKMDNLPN